jgi:ribonuclease-3
MKISEKQINNLIGIEPKNLDLYLQAFTHKSCCENSIDSNERLEFIGDSVLNVIVTAYLYEKYPQENEGFLTRIRTKIVSGKTLSGVALDLGFQDYITMNDKGMRNEWYKNPRILEDSLESFIGAVYIDLGIKIAKEFILSRIVKTLDSEFLLEDTNYKDILMRYLQGRKLQLPEYKLYSENTSTNVKLFVVQVFIQSKIVSEGIHRVKKQAEQNAAKRALECFNII